jgi:starch-binding outer membrane protein SusE/F
MRKLLYFSLLAAAGLFAASCTMDEDRVVFDPNDATAPSVASIQGATLAADGDAISFDFNLPDYQLAAGKTYSLYAATDQAFTSPEKVSATISTDGNVSIKQSDLNSLILNLGGEPEKEFTLYFRLSSWLATDKGTAVESSLLYSNIVSASFIPYDMTILDKDTYQTVWVQGSYAGWAFDNCQYLYNYSKDGKTFSGVVDLGDKASEGIKITGAADWGDATGNWGTANAGDPAEASSVTLLNGSNDNVTCYSKRFYKFSFDNTTLVLTKEWGADQIGIVGTINNWSAPDVVMNYNADYVRFWADLEVEGDQEIKFRADEDWTWNWGADAAAGGSNVAVSTGKYRVYLDLNKGTVELNEKMYGQPEPTASGSSDEPEPDKPAAWSLVGIGGDWETDIDLTNTTGDIWVARSVSLTASDEFKIRADHAWTTAVGGPEENSTSTIDPSNVYGVYKPTLGTAFATGDKNIQVGVEGVYDITFDYAASTILIEEHKAAYTLIGEINGDSSWKQDVLMTQDGDVWTSPVVNITGGFKIRYDYNWDNCYGAPADFTPVLGEAFTAEQPGSNITVPEKGDYKVTFDAAAKTITITAVAFPETMYMIGAAFGNWDWSSDGIVDMVPVHSGEGQFWTVRYIKANSPFKFCPAKEWNGKDFCSQTTDDGFTVDNNNCIVDKDGLYLIHIDLKNEKLHVEQARIYGIGVCFGGWDAGMESALFTNIDGTASVKLPADGEVRMYVASSIANTDWWTREFIILDGKIVYRGTGGDQTRVACTAGQTVTLDFNAGTGSIN